MRNLVTGGAGFIGSHLINHLIRDDEEVICIDNFYSGRRFNISKWENNPNFEFIHHDIINPINLNVDRIWHLACPASPSFYQSNPIKTTKTNFLGTLNMLGLAKRLKAKILFASTSEIYGDAEVSPQVETYKGSVNPIGIRSCYDEGKRVAESLCFDYFREHNVDIRVARIFNTYGPGMMVNDGRVVSNFIVQALKGEEITIYGDGFQTRSFCYVTDTVKGLLALMDNKDNGPINIGNENEITIKELAEKIRSKINPKLNIVYKDLPKDDPIQRRPCLKKANSKLNFFPSVNIEIGLDNTISYFRGLL